MGHLAQSKDQYWVGTMNDLSVVHLTALGCLLEANAPYQLSIGPVFRNLAVR